MLGIQIQNSIVDLTAHAWVSGPNLAPQKFLLSQQCRYLMRCKKYLKKIFLSCLVSEIQLFVYIFGWISKWPPEVRKGSLVKFFEVSYYQKNFQPESCSKWKMKKTSWVFFLYEYRKFWSISSEFKLEHKTFILEVCIHYIIFWALVWVKKDSLSIDETRLVHFLIGSIILNEIIGSKYYQV